MSFEHPNKKRKLWKMPICGRALMQLESTPVEQAMQALRPEKYPASALGGGTQSLDLLLGRRDGAKL